MTDVQAELGKLRELSSRVPDVGFKAMVEAQIASRIYGGMTFDEAMEAHGRYTEIVVKAVVFGLTGLVAVAALLGVIAWA